jgi:transposase InsO family protein
MFIKDNCAWINIETACTILNVGKSAYYDWLRNYEIRQAKLLREQELAQNVVNAFNRSHQTYGGSRLFQRLQKDNVPCSYPQILEIMKINDLVPCYSKKYKVTTTNSNHKYKVFDNLLNRDFKAAAPNLVWVGDITYIRTDEGWLYLATVIDLFSRRIIGYQMSNRMTKDLVISALQKALKLRKNPNNVIFHSDRGSQYSSHEYKATLAKNNLRGSMSKKGDCWDNAVAESFFATLKKEYVYQTHFKTRAEAQLGIFDYIETWYNKERIHSYLNGDSPIEFEMKYWEQKTTNDIMELGCYRSCGI